MALNAAVQHCLKAAQKTYQDLDDSWKTITKEELEDSDGRRKPTQEWITTGSFLYIAYSDQQVLYVGQTSKSIKKRFICDGSGAHNAKNWYPRMTHIKYVRASCEVLPDHVRMMLEQALTIVLRPEFCDRLSR